MIMKKTMRYQVVMALVCVVLLNFFSSCATTKDSGAIPEDELIVTRKYVGNFLDYRHTAPERVTDPHIVWIKTTQDSIYGKLSVLSRECEFEEGDRLFLRRKYVTPGVWGYWEYQIENDKNVFYKLSEFQHDRKVPVQSLF
jgi:hypothetical protein